MVKRDTKFPWPQGLTNQTQIRNQDIYIAPGSDIELMLTEQGVVTLVVSDFQTAATFVDQEEWYSQWRDNDLLYQSPVIDIGDPTRARVSRFGVNNDANTMADAVKSGLFAQNPPIFLRKRGKTTQQQLDGWMALLSVLFSRMKLQYWAGLGIHCQTLQGTGIMKGGWSKRTRTVLKRKPKGAPARVENASGTTERVHTKDIDSHTLQPDTITESYPWIEYRTLGTTLFDPKWNTPNDPSYAGYVIDVDYTDWTRLRDLKNDDSYTIPDLANLLEWLKERGSRSAEQGTSIEAGLSRSGSPVGHAADRSTSTSIDPTRQPILMLTRTDCDKVMTVLKIDSGWVVIQNRSHHLNRPPHFTMNWRNIDNAGYGMGIGRLTGSDQRVEQGVLNQCLELLAYQLNPAILYARGSGNAPTGDRVVRRGGFIGVDPIGDDVRKAWAVAELPEVPAAAWQTIQYSQQSSQNTSGADSTFMPGNLGGKGSSAARTATGAGRIAAKSDARVQTPVEAVEVGFIVPWTEMLISMVKMYMPLEEIRGILSDKLGEAIADELTQDGAILDAEMECEVLAGAKLAAKAAMAAQLPELMQIFQQPQLLDQLHQEGLTIRLKVLLDVLFAVSEYKMEDEIIVPLTDQQKQHMFQMLQMQQGGGVKGQADIQREQLRGQNELQKEQLRGKNEIAKTYVQHQLEAENPTDKAQERNGGGGPLARAEGLVERGDMERMLQGQGPSVLAGA